MILVAPVHSPQNWFRHIGWPGHKELVPPWCRIVVHCRASSSNSSSSSFTGPANRSSGFFLLTSYLLQQPSTPPATLSFPPLQFKQNANEEEKKEAIAEKIASALTDSNCSNYTLPSEEQDLNTLSPLLQFKSTLLLQQLHLLF